MSNVSPEVIEKWRKDFELYHHIPDFAFWNGKEYAHKNGDLSGAVIDLNDKIHTWCLSRQSAVIEIPCGDINGKYEFFTGRNSGICECRIAIEKQGYQVNFNQPIQGQGEL